MTTLEIIVRELQRQAYLSKANTPWFNADNPADAIIDGHVDLIALAKAIDQMR